MEEKKQLLVSQVIPSYLQEISTCHNKELLTQATKKVIKGLASIGLHEHTVLFKPVLEDEVETSPEWQM